MYVFTSPSSPRMPWRWLFVMMTFETGDLQHVIEVSSRRLLIHLPHIHLLLLLFLLLPLWSYFINCPFVISVDIKAIAEQSGLCEDVVRAAQEHWVCMRSAVAFKPLLLRFYQVLSILWSLYGYVPVLVNSHLCTYVFLCIYVYYMSFYLFINFCMYALLVMLTFICIRYLKVCPRKIKEVDFVIIHFKIRLSSSAYYFRDALFRPHFSSREQMLCHICLSLFFNSYLLFLNEVWVLTILFPCPAPDIQNCRQIMAHTLYNLQRLSLLTEMIRRRESMKRQECINYHTERKKKKKEKEKMNMWKMNEEASRGHFYNVL